LNDLAALAGEPATLTVGATGADLHYRWFKDDHALVAADAPVLALPAPTAADAGSYRVVVTGSAGRVVSRTASLVVVSLQTTAAPLPGIAGVTRLTQRLAFAGGADGLAVAVLLPAHWRFLSGDAMDATTKPAAGDTDLLEWTWSRPPAAALVIESLLSAPAGEATLAPVQGALVIRQAHGTTTLPFDAKR
jgi:hypothetical protein